MAAADEARLHRGRAGGIGEQSVIDPARGCSQPVQDARLHVLADQADQHGIPAEFRDVAGEVAGAAQHVHRFAPLMEHRDRRLGRDPADLAIDIAVEHDVADDQHPPAGKVGQASACGALAHGTTTAGAARSGSRTPSITTPPATNSTMIAAMPIRWLSVIAVSAATMAGPRKAVILEPQPDRGAADIGPSQDTGRDPLLAVLIARSVPPLGSEPEGPVEVHGNAIDDLGDALPWLEGALDQILGRRQSVGVVERAPVQTGSYQSTGRIEAADLWVVQTIVDVDTPAPRPPASAGPSTSKRPGVCVLHLLRIARPAPAQQHERDGCQ